MIKWLIVLVLAVAVFGGAVFFAYDLFVRPEKQIQAEKESALTAPVARPDTSLPDFQAAAKLRQEGKLMEARGALTTFLQKYPGGMHVDEAEDLLGQINVEMLLSPYPAPDKQEYIVRGGDVLARVAAKTKSTPELIMRMNNLNGTMLHVGERLFISHPDFSLLLQRKAQAVILLNHGQFFKRYRVRSMKLPARQPPKMVTKVAETIAWKNGKRVGFGTKDFLGSTRWVRIAAPGYTLYTEPDLNHQPGVPSPPLGLALAGADLDELSGLVNSKTAVTIIE